LRRAYWVFALLLGACFWGLVVLATRAYRGCQGARIATMLSRRIFLRRSLLAAPAVILTPGLLMPVRALQLPRSPLREIVFPGGFLIPHVTDDEIRKLITEFLVEVDGKGYVCMTSPAM